MTKPVLAPNNTDQIQTVMYLSSRLSRFPVGAEAEPSPHFVLCHTLPLPMPMAFGFFARRARPKTKQPKLQRYFEVVFLKTVVQPGHVIDVLFLKKRRVEKVTLLIIVTRPYLKVF